jgi:hypothetical protein
MLKYLLVINDPLKGNDVAGRIAAKFPADAFRNVGSAAWCIKTELGTQQISEALFDASVEQRSTFHIVARLDVWWGWNDKALWEWLGG